MKSECDAQCEVEKLDNGYCCEQCNDPITICPDCKEIVIPCKCGHCKQGLTFCESE